MTFSYHGNSVIDEGLPEHHVVEIRIHPDLRPYMGALIGMIVTPSLTSEKMARTATGSTAEMMLVKVKT